MPVPGAPAPQADELTVAGAVVGTPGYMAPEQAAGGPITTAADVYGLGAILYDLLTGTPPFRGASPRDTLRQVQDVPLVPPRDRNPAVHPDLDALCRKCLARDPAGRYDSAAAVAEDLERFVAGRPVVARPLGAVSRAGRWAARNPALAGMLAVTTTLVVAAAVGSTIAAVSFRRLAAEQTRLADSANRANDQLRDTAYFRSLALADLELAAGAADRAGQLLADCPPDLRRWEWQLQNRRCRSGPVVLAGGVGAIETLAFSPDGSRLAAAGGDGKTAPIAVWDVAARQVVRQLTGHRVFVNEVAFGPAGDWLASASHDGTVIVWDVEAGVPRATLRGHSDHVGTVALSPDGRCIASGAKDGLVKLWDAVTGAEQRTLRGHTSFPRRVRFTPDGGRLVSGSWDTTVRVWDVGTGQLLRTLSGHKDQVLGVAVSPSGQLVASAGGMGLGREIKLWDTASGAEVFTRRGFADVTEAIAFSPDGRCFATVSGHSAGPGAVNIWEVGGGQNVITLTGHTKATRAVAFSPDGQWLATGGMDGRILLYDLTPPTP